MPAPSVDESVSWRREVETQDSEDVIELEIELNQQQDVVLKQIQAEGRHGTTEEEVILNVFRDFLRLTGTR
jgi:hypothetical protein